jgi:hypothetical protein
MWLSQGHRRDHSGRSREYQHTGTYGKHLIDAPKNVKLTCAVAWWVHEMCVKSRFHYL